MGDFWQAAAAAMISVIAVLTISKRCKDISQLLTVAVCVMMTLTAMSYLKPVVEFIRQLQSIAALDNEQMLIMLKSVGICVVGHIAASICADSGNAALGKSLQLLSASVILWLSLPMMTQLLQLLQQIMGEL